MSEYDFVAVVLENSSNGWTKVEMRNRFSINSSLELLSKTKNNVIINIEKINDLDGCELSECKIPKQQVYIKCDQDLKKYEILRRKK